MKKTIIAILQLQLITPTLPAAVPLRWTVETSRVLPAVFEAYQGETLTFEAALQSHGKPLEAPVNYSFFWQTNGMGSTYWEAPAQRGSGVSPLESGSVVSPLERGSGVSPLVGETNVLFATWLPAYDVGARVYNCFIGSPSNIYHAAFQLRLRPSPGALPNALPLPTPVIDFARIHVLNPPWGSGGGGGCDTNAVDALANSAVVTNALTVATTNRVAALETATNNLTSSVSGLASSVSDLSSSVSGLASSVSGLASSKADRPALPVTAGNLAALTADGNLSDSGKKASDFAPAVEGGYLPLNDGGHVIGDTTFLGNFYAGPLGDMIGVTRDAGYLYKYDSEGIKWYYGYREDANELAVKGDISAAISSTNPTFSNAVLAVGLNIDTNSVAVLNEIAATFGDFPIEGTATTVGGLLAALAAAAAWLKKNKVGSFKSVGGATATVENGVAELDDFFTNSNSLLNARITYERNATGIKDRAFNTLSFDGTEYNLSTALAAVTPTASGQPRDLLIVATATAATTISFTAGTIKGDKPTIDGSGTWLITLTEYASGVWYCRQIKMEDAA